MSRIDRWKDRFNERKKKFNAFLIRKGIKEPPIKEGDRVRLITTRHGDSRRHPVWKGKYGGIEGTVRDVICKTRYPSVTVRWDHIPKPPPPLPPPRAYNDIFGILNFQYSCRFSDTEWESGNPSYVYKDLEVIQPLRFKIVVRCKKRKLWR